MFGPPPKRPKKETFTGAMTSAAVAFANAISPSTQETSSPLHHQPSAMLSPMKSLQLQRKNLSQLHFIQQLFEDKVLTQEEYIEQKRGAL